MDSGSASRVPLATGVTVPWFSRGARDGLPVVLLHGWGESSRVFDRLFPALPDRFRVLAFDQRGHGGASKPHRGYELGEAASDVTAFLDAMALSSAVLLGSSSGGYIAQQVAVDRPERVLALILVGAPRSLSGRAPFADEVDALTDPVDPVWVRQSLEWFPTVEPVPETYLDDRVRDGVRMPAFVLQSTLAGLSSAVPPSEAGRIRCPTLILRGAEDGLIPLSEHEALTAAIPGSRLLVYERTGHLVLWERPEWVASDVEDFLAGGVPPPGG